MQAAPLVSIGDNVDVFFNGSSSVQWQSNVFYDDADEQDDIRFTVSPGFEVNVGRGLSNLDLSIVTRYDIVRYDELSDLDSEQFHIKAISSYRSSRWDVDGLVSYDEQQSSGKDGNTNQKGQLTQSENIRANLNGEYRLSPKFSVGSGVNYSDKQYKDQESLADRVSFTVPVDIFYELTPKVDLSVGYTHTSTDVGETNIGDTVNGREVSSYDKTGHFFNIGARGELLPKLSGFFKFGYRTSDSDDSTIQTVTGGTPDLPTSTNRDSRGTVGLDANFTYAATPKLTTAFALHRGFGVGGEGQGTTTTRANLSANYAINSNYSASANFGYTLREYEAADREDNVYSTGVRLSYVPNRYWRFSTGYNYSENDSNAPGQGYEAHSIVLSASLRY
ncbi:MAG: outer membrane beta-barrel protein [Opitutae bacterium]|nr:outer membrane beta-barrel protein [Opitutae bacterium]